MKHRTFVPMGQNTTFVSILSAIAACALSLLPLASAAADVEFRRPVIVPEPTEMSFNAA